MIQDRLAAKRQYYKTHRKRIRAHENKYSKERRRRIRESILMFYGGGKAECIRCGYQGMALQLDHIADNGAHERKVLGRTSGRLYAWLIANYFPPGYQTLCANCNCEKEAIRINLSSIEE